MRARIVVSLIVAVSWLAGSTQHPAPRIVLTNSAVLPARPAQPPHLSLSDTAEASEIAARPAPEPSAGAGDEQTLAQYRAWIHEARQAHPYSDSEERMYAVMMCESRGRAAAVNPDGPYTGLFQYHAPTWNDAWNTYRDQGILDPRAQIFATALAWQRNMQHHWGCYTHPR